ncbi:BGTF surface domain-containing protein [Haloarcula pelagica]|uniref:BGTF surface domain-containing protein n=1 Tax=Haloarcula pelagica TaxID=3033389 RepID=UPI0024C42C31|nr:BGTF surface domain-containing protein [Halomicroarcula sp. YJ-61-S]
MSRAGAVLLALALVGTALAAPVSAADTGGTQLDADGGTVTLAPGANQTVSGETDLDPGTTVLVRLQSQQNESSPFLKQQTVTVNEDGTFAAQFDMTMVEPETAFNASVRYDSRILTNTTGTVVPCEGGCEVPADSESQTGSNGTTLEHEGETVRVASAPGQLITGQTDIDPGTALTVRLRSADPSAPFLRQGSATVQSDGSFRTATDMSSVPVGTDFEVTVLSGGETVVETGGTVVECDSDCRDVTPTPTPEDEKSVTRAASVDTGTVDMSPIAEGVAGGTVPLNVSVGDRDNASLVIGGPAVNYQLNATVRDGNGDRYVMVQFHTGAVGSDEPTLTARDDGDTVTIRSEPDLNVDRLDPASYDTALFASEAPTGDPVMEGTIVLHAGETDGEPAESSESSAASDTETGLGLDETIVRTRTGQQTTLALRMGNESTATVAIGTPESGVEVIATVEDGTGDGAVPLLFDTTATGDGDQPALVAAQEGDSVTVTTQRADGAVAPGDYDIDIYAGSSAEGSPEDIGTLSVQGSLTNDTDSTPPATPSEESQSSLLGSGALAVGGVLAIAGLGLVLGLFRN